MKRSSSRKSNHSIRQSKTYKESNSYDHGNNYRRSYDNGYNNNGPYNNGNAYNGPYNNGYPYNGPYNNGYDYNNPNNYNQYGGYVEQGAINEEKSEPKDKGFLSKIFGSDSENESNHDKKKKKDSKLETVKSIASAAAKNKDTIIGFAKKIFGK